MTALRREGLARRVLVIEDFPDLAELLRDVLTSWGCDVRVAPDGVLGLHAARAFRPHVVICDIGLPRLDGYGVIRALRGDPALDGLYAVALTAFTAAEDKAQARAAGFDAHVAKPFRLATLERLLRAANEAAGPGGAGGGDTGC